MDFFSQFDPTKHGAYDLRDAIRASDNLTRFEREILLGVIDEWGEEDIREGETMEQARADLLQRLANALTMEAV